MGWEDRVGLLDITILTPPSCGPSDHGDGSLRLRTQHGEGYALKPLSS
jgi:hypothetical protein